MIVHLPLLRLFITLVFLTALAGCSGGAAVLSSATPPASPTITLTQVIPTLKIIHPTSAPDWSQVEAPLSSSILGTSGGKCEWEALGWLEQKVFVWVLCQASAASVPPCRSTGSIDHGGRIARRWNSLPGQRAAAVSSSRASQVVCTQLWCESSRG